MKTRKNGMNVRSCEKKFCKEYFSQRFESLLKESLKKWKLPYKKSTAAQKKELYKQCITGFCTPGCKGTLYEPGKGVPKKLIDDIKKNKTLKKKEQDQLIKITKNMRAVIFKKKTDVLKDGFYEKFDKDLKKEYKEQGALSGCVLSM
jgi:hypothetical protein